MQGDGQRSIEGLSFPCGRVMGIQIRLHVLLPLVAILAALSPVLASHPWQSVLLALLVAGPLLVITVLIHELGHVIAAKRCGCTTDHILLWPLGGLAFIGDRGVKPKEQILISGSGPATHLPMLALWAGVLAVLHGSVTLSTHGLWVDTNFGSLICIAMLNTNLVMLLFNLLVPCFPLDCSRILASILLLRGMEPGNAAKVIVICSVIALAAVAFLSVWSSLTGHSSSSFNVVMAVWLALQTWKLHQARVTGQLAFYPLFSAAMNTGASTTPPVQSSTGTGPNFQPFQEGPTAVGKPTSTPGSSQVCLASAIALLMAVSVAQVGTSSS